MLHTLLFFFNIAQTNQPEEQMLEKEKNVTVKWNNRAVKGNNSKSSGEQTLENDLFWQPAAMHAALLTGTYPTSVIPGSSGTYRRCGSTQVGPYLFTYAFREHRPRWGFCSVSGGSHYVYGVESKTAGVSHNRGKVHTDCLDGMFSSNQRDLPSSVCVCVCPTVRQCVLLWVCTPGV